MITTIHEFLIKSQIFQKVVTLTPTMLISEKREFNFTQLDVKKIQGVPFDLNKFSRFEVDKM